MNFSLFRNVSHRNRNCERHSQGSSTITAVFKWHDYYCKQLFLSDMITFNSTIKLPPAPDSSRIIQQYKCTSPGLLSRAHRHIIFGKHKDKRVKVDKLTWCRMLKLIPFSLQFHGISPVIVSEAKWRSWEQCTLARSPAVHLQWFTFQDSWFLKGMSW